MSRGSCAHRRGRRIRSTSGSSGRSTSYAATCTATLFTSLIARARATGIAYRSKAPDLILSHLGFEKEDTKLTLMEARPTLFMGTARSTQKLASTQERQELTPLDPESIVTLYKVLNPMLLGQAFKAYFDEGGSKAKGNSAVFQILEHLEKFHDSDVKLVGRLREEF